MTPHSFKKNISALFKWIYILKKEENTNIQNIQKCIKNIQFRYILSEIFNGSLQNYEINDYIPLTSICSAAQLSKAGKNIEKKLHRELKSNTILINEFNLVRDAIDEIDNILINYFDINKYQNFLSSLKNFINDIHPYNNTIPNGYRSLIENISKYFPIYEEIIWKNIISSLKKEGRWGGMLVKACSANNFLRFVIILRLKKTISLILF